jgi:hypothetical protein
MTVHFLTRARVAASALVLVGLTACGSVPPPTTDLAKADSAMQAAELAGAREHAPIELRAAEATKLRLDKAMAKENYERAARLAEQVRAEAELAKATAEAEKSRLALQESQDNIDTMVREVGRVAGE